MEGFRLASPVKTSRGIWPPNSIRRTKLDQLRHVSIGTVRIDAEYLCHDPEWNDRVSAVMADGHGGKPVAFGEPRHRPAQSSDAQVSKGANCRLAGYGRSGIAPEVR